MPSPSLGTVRDRGYAIFTGDSPVRCASCPEDSEYDENHFPLAIEESATAPCWNSGAKDGCAPERLKDASQESEASLREILERWFCQSEATDLLR